MLLLLVAGFIVPFHWRVVRMSAWEIMGERFGFGGRLDTSFGFLADRVFNIGLTLFDPAIAVDVLTHGELKSVIIGMAMFTAAYVGSLTRLSAPGASLLIGGFMPMQ